MIHDNAKEDKAIIESMPKQQQLMMSNKKLFTLRQLATQVDYAGTQAVNASIAGFHLTGLALYTHYFTERLVVPIATKEQVLSSADVNNKILLNKVASAGCKEIDHQLWAQTVEEVKAGWLQGKSNDRWERSVLSQEGSRLNKEIK